MTTPLLNRAGFWPRLAAAAIDYGIIAAVCAILGAVFGAASQASGELGAGWADGLGSDTYLAALAGLVAGFALVGAIYMSLEVLTVATLGKMAVGLMVVADDGRHASTGVRLARYLVKNCHLVLGAAAVVSGLWFVSALVPLATLVVVAGGTMVLSHDHRALHDLVAHTAVVARPPNAVRS